MNGYKKEEDLEDFLRSQKNGVVISRERRVQRLGSLYIMKRFSVGDETYVVLGNHGLDKGIQTPLF